MRKLKGLWATGLLCLLLACLTIGVNAKELQFSNFYAYAEADNTATRINATVVGDTTYLILPGGKTASQVPLYFSLTDPDAAVSAAGTSSATGLQSGQALDLPALCGGTRTQYTITLRAKSGSDTAVQKIVFQTTEGVSALFLTSDDPVNQGRAWVEASEDKSNNATGSMILLDETGSTMPASSSRSKAGATPPGRARKSPTRSSWTEKPTCSRPATPPTATRPGSCSPTTLTPPCCATASPLTWPVQCRWTRPCSTAR